MALKLKELREKRANVVKDIQQMRNLLTDEKPSFTPEEEARWKKINADYDGLGTQIEVLERADGVAAEMEKLQEHGDLNDDPGNENRNRGGGGANAPTEEQRSLALQAWCRTQMGEDITEEHQRACRAARLNPSRRHLEFNLPSTQSRMQMQRVFNSTSEARRMTALEEHRTAMSGIVGSQGGALVPETFLRTLEVNMLAFGGVRQVAELMTTASGDRMTWPTADDTSNEGEQVGENVNVDNSGAGGPLPNFKQIFWDAYTYSSKAVLVPFSLLQDAFVDLPSVLGQMIGERLGRITNRRFTTGTGAGQPKGIVTASSLGVTAASATAIAYDEIIRLEHSVDPAYRNGAGYMFNDAILLALRLLKDGNGKYLWQEGANSGAPATVNNRPYAINQNMASSIVSGAKSVLFGQLKAYKVRTVGTMRLYRLEERYRDKDQDGFIGLIREDGNLLDAGTAPVKHLVH